MRKNKRNGVAVSQNGHQNGPQNGRKFDPMALTWSEKYDRQISKIWKLLPESVAKIIASVAVFMLGVSINGDWILVWVHTLKQFGWGNVNSTDGGTGEWFTAESLKMKGFFSFWWSSLAISYGMYLSIGGFIHWYYYVRQRDKPEEWKCQPQKWLSPDLERHEIILGSFTLFLNATVSSIMSCYIFNGGFCTVYYDITELGWFYFILQFPLIFIYQDYMTYWLHRIYHLPFLYKHFHKLHHKYKQPTAFSVTAIHPVESLHIQLTLAAPLFLVPIHWLPFYVSTFYAYYHGIIDHSGVNFKSFWWQPWQPDAIFHDNHHQYFHVNFAFNISYWDKLHGTYRLKDRVYNEDIFYGTGKTVDSATTEELAADLEERELENPLAYRAEMPYKFSSKEVKKLKKTK